MEKKKNHIQILYHFKGKEDGMDFHIRAIRRNGCFEFLAVDVAKAYGVDYDETFLERTVDIAHRSCAWLRLDKTILPYNTISYEGLLAIAYAVRPKDAKSRVKWRKLTRAIKYALSDL